MVAPEEKPQVEPEPDEIAKEQQLALRKHTESTIREAERIRRKRGKKR